MNSETTNTVRCAPAKVHRQLPPLLVVVDRRLFWWCAVTALMTAGLTAFIGLQQGMAAITHQPGLWFFAAILGCMTALSLALHHMVKRWVQQPLRALMDRLDHMESGSCEALLVPETFSSREFSDIHRKIERLCSFREARMAALYGRLSIDKERLDIIARKLGLEIEAKKKVEASLRLSESRFRALIENNTDTILVIDAGGAIRYANPAAKSVFGRSAEDLVGTQFGFPIGGDEAAAIEVIDTSGHVHTVEMRVTEMEWDDTKAHVATLHDVTAQVEINRRLAESEKKFRTLFEDSKDAICISSRKGHILDCNQASETVLGHPVSALKAMNWMALFENREDRLFFQLKIEIQGAVKDYPLRLVTGSGEIRDCLVTASIILSDQNEIIGYQGIVRDMTEITAYRKNLEEMVARRTTELKRSLAATEAANQHIHGIIASVADGLIVTDPQNRVAIINPAAESLLSVHAAQVIGLPIAAVIAHESLREHLLSCLSTDESCRRYEFEMPPDAQHRTRFIRALTSWLADTGEASSGTVTLLSDVTYEQEVNRMKSEFISTAAHELRTPLTSIRGFSEILLTRDDLKEHERRKFLKYIYDQGNVLSTIINDLLDLSRMEAGAGFVVNKGTHDISDMVRGICERFQLETNLHTFFLDLPNGTLPVSCDRGKMEQVLDNIYSNAIKYAPAGGIIETAVRPKNGWVDIAVTDSGIGMTPEQVARIFDKFYRADASNTAVAGTGLGMSIVRQIVESHGGQVTVNSRKEVGTTVSVHIPTQVPCESQTAVDDACPQLLPLCGDPAHLFSLTKGDRT